MDKNPQAQNKPHQRLLLNPKSKPRSPARDHLRNQAQKRSQHHQRYDPINKLLKPAETFVEEN